MPILLNGIHIKKKDFISELFKREGELVAIKRKGLTCIKQKRMMVAGREVILIMYQGKIEFKFLDSNDKYRSIDYLHYTRKKKAERIMRGY